MTTFLATFDYLSVAERKNPFGAIAAFRQAFPGDAIDAALVIKTLNGEQRPDAEQRVLDAAGSDRRITVVDEQFSDADQAALIAAVQCLVSLHRGEGLGLHIADAMWLGTPVLASRYGGSMDLLDDETAALVDVHLVPAERTEGAYPAGAMWADPVIDQAATWMRRMALEPYERARLADAARRRIAEQPSAEEVGRRMARSLGKPRLAVEAATAADRGRGLRRIGRMVTSPARGYINRHFEMTKEEIRLQVHLLAEHQAMTMARLGGTGQRVDEQQITELGNVVSEIGVHQTRVITALREEVAEVRRALDEMRDDIAVLTQALVHLAEPREAGDE